MILANPPECEQVRILFVDDDPILVEFAKVHLATATTSIESEPNGALGWERLQRERFDLVLLDIEMPVMDGFTLLQKMRANFGFRRLPVVMLTGREDVETVERAYRLGASTFVTKPINWQLLSHFLKYVLRASQTEDDLLRQRQKSEELVKLTNSLLSLIRIEARTPLDSIIGFSNCLRQELQGLAAGENVANYAGHIGTAARDMLDRFMDLIQYAQLASGEIKLAPDDYLSEDLLKFVVADMRNVAPTAEAVSISLKPGERFFVHCDRRWLTRALALTLAHAAAQSGSNELELGVSRGIGGAVAFTLGARLSTPGDSDRVAEDRLSNENIWFGKTLGISFAQRVVELHGGALKEISSESGESRTEIVLPTNPASASAIWPPSEPEAKVA